MIFLKIGLSQKLFQILLFLVNSNLLRAQIETIKKVNGLS